jgi:hypothetical protein
MLVRDMLTGQLHEVPEYGEPDVAEPDMSGWPDPQVYGLGELHDGGGNSLGLWFLPKLIQGATGLVKNIIGGAMPAAPEAAPASACPPCPVCPTCGAPQWTPGPPPPAYLPRRRRRR